jgi:hypothetical protein
MPMVCGDIGGEPYGDECDNRSLSGHAFELTATPNRGSAATTTQLPEVYASITTVETAALLSAVRRVD